MKAQRSRPTRIAAALRRGDGQNLVELLGDREVQLPFDLDVPAAGPQLSLGDVKSLHWPIVIGRRRRRAAMVATARATGSEGR